MSRKTFIFLSLLLLLLLGLRYLQISDERRQSAAPVIQSLKNFSADSVQRIEIHGAGENNPPSIILYREDKEWFVDGPEPRPARKRKITGLIDSISGLKGFYVNPAQLTAQSCGLDGTKPLQIILSSAEGPFLHLRIGNVLPTAETIFAALNGSEKILRCKSDLLLTLDIFSVKDFTRLHPAKWLAPVQNTAPAAAPLAKQLQTITLQAPGKKRVRTAGQNEFYAAAEILEALLEFPADPSFMPHWFFRRYKIDAAYSDGTSVKIACAKPGLNRPSYCVNKMDGKTLALPASDFRELFLG